MKKYLKTCWVIDYVLAQIALVAIEVTAPDSFTVWGGRSGAGKLRTSMHK